MTWQLSSVQFTPKGSTPNWSQSELGAPGLTLVNMQGLKVAVHQSKTQLPPKGGMLSPSIGFGIVY